MFFQEKKSNGAQIMDVLFLQNNVDSSVQELSALSPFLLRVTTFCPKFWKDEDQRKWVPGQT